MTTIKLITLDELTPKAKKAMITRIEMDYMEAVKKIAREMSKPKEVDWEQRRYEIAKDVLASAIRDPYALTTDETGGDREYYALNAVKYADALIAELQKPKRQ